MATRTGKESPDDARPAPREPAAAPRPAPWYGRALWWLARFALLAAGALVGLVSLVALGDHLAGGVTRSLSSSLSFDLLLPRLQGFEPLAERSVVHSPDGTTIATLHGEVNRRQIALRQLPPHVPQAVLVAEDRRFYDHPGFDVEGIGRAAMANVRARQIAQGGSTITQQLAKIVVGDDVTVERKVEELVYAIALEQRYTKEQLLERYINQVYFGAGAYGIAAAAEEFFAVPPERLRVEQAALLAGLIRSPSRLDPRADPEAARARRDAILDGMVETGDLGAQRAGLLKTLPLGVVPARDAVALEPYVVEAVKQEFFANPAFGETREERIEALFGGGLRIYTTIDPELQRAAQRIVRERFPGEAGVTAALTAVDPRSGEIRVAAFGRDFDREQFNLALQGRRQPGSAFKPFVLTAALERGLPLGLNLRGRSPAYFEGVCGWASEDPVGCDTEEDKRGVRNYGGASYGRLDLREALVRSVNTAFAELVLLVGTEHVLDVADRLGVDPRAFGGRQNPSIALGGLHIGISPLEMASAYGTLANGGRHARPHVIARVLDRDGDEIYRADGPAEQVVAPDVSATVLDLMQDVVRRGTGTAAQLPGWEVAGKTGTTQDNSDVWFVGATPVLSAAVWVGNPEERETLHGMSSSRTAAPLWREFMGVALAGTQPVPLPDPSAGLVGDHRPAEVAVPGVVGLAAVEAAAALRDARLLPRQRLVGDRAPSGTVVWQQPRAGTTARAGDPVVIGVSDRGGG